MRFQDSGLLNNKLVKSAFDYAQTYTQSLVKEVLHSYREAVELDYQDDLALLDMELKFEDITPKEHEERKAQLDSFRTEDLEAMTPEIVADDLRIMFADHNVGSALEIQQYSDNATPALIAAALLAECARSPRDCKKIEDQFGAEISGLVADILHVEAYPGARGENLAASGSDTKRLFMATLANSFRQAAAVVKTLKKGEKALMPPEEAESAFRDAKPLWGNDKKLDARLVDIFNYAAEVLSSNYRMEVSEKGALELVNNTPKIPVAKPARGKKPGSFGDDGF